MKTIISTLFAILILAAIAAPASAQENFVPASNVVSTLRSNGFQLLIEDGVTPKETDIAGGQYKTFIVMTKSEQTFFDIFLVVSCASKEACKALIEQLRQDAEATDSNYWLLSGSGKLLVMVPRANADGYIVRLNEALKGL